MMKNNKMTYSTTARSQWRKGKRKKKIKIVTPKKLLIRLPLLSAHIKVGNNSYKLNNEVFFINTINSPKSFKII